MLGLICAATSVAAQTPEPRDTRDLVLERRIAMVIGNNAYGSAPLQNAVADARAVSTTLRELGFAVTLIEDANRSTMVRSIAAIGDTLTDKDVVFFFYAGHGMQIGGENYLIPTDFGARSGTSVRLEALATSDVQQAFSTAKVSLLVLDACRNNPFGAERGGVGLAPMEARGSMVAYATAAGQTASDNPAASNGLFTQELLKALREPDVSARNLFYNVRQRVHAASAGRQFPAVYDGLLGDAILRGSPRRADPVAPAANVTPIAVERTVDPADTALWSAIEKSGRLSDYEVYLKQYPNGVFAALARSRIEGSAPARPVPQNVAESNLVGSQWTGTLRKLDRNGRVKGETSISLTLDENGQGSALYGNEVSKLKKWTRVGTELILEVNDWDCNNPKLRATLTGDKILGTYDLSICFGKGEWSAERVR
jgi:uncharacterized caspase-like protein